jgi:hypothetical protein
MLTTTPTSRPASWANTSANGPSGGCARLGAMTIANSANEAATATPRRPNNFTLASPFAGRRPHYGTTTERLAVSIAGLDVTLAFPARSI